ncbi:PQQ-dependent sugar dehydrogenase [Nocardiopsis algeriensis]|uniref:PQQ-dependent sugar dehydrogenase n=1 Tax=Nocardiopsis algeriensis TaxID=1478215 RepID=UPI003B43B754
MRPRNATTAARLLAAASALSLAAACSGEGGEDPGGGAPPSAEDGDPAPEQLDAGTPETVATGLEVPWGIAHLPDGSALVSERDGEIVRLAANGDTSSVGEVEGVDATGEGGLLGLALDPAFPNEPYVYAYLTTDADNRVVRMEYGADGGLGEPEVLVEGIPSAGNHNGGRIAFGPDGFLYVATGDGGRPGLAQDRDSLGGKILRVDRDGEPAEDNPFDSPVLSYGHRNVQGLAWDGEGNLYATEFGQDRLDEVNLIEPGANYGWPEVEGPGGGEEYTDPLVTWEPDEASPSGAAVAGGSLWVAGLAGERLWEIPLEGDGELGEPVAHLTGEYGRLRTVLPAPGGGGLWVATSNLDGRGDPAEGDDRILHVPLE